MLGCIYPFILKHMTDLKFEACLKGGGLHETIHVKPSLGAN